MVLGKVAKMAQMHHDDRVDALRLAISACSCRAAAEPRYRALTGGEGMAKCQRNGDIVAVLLRLELAAVVIAHASSKSYSAQTVMQAGWTVARAEQSKRLRNGVPDHAALGFVLFAVGTRAQAE